MATVQFDSAAERREAAVFGMWAFLATEVAFFGPLFFGYVHGRVYSHDAFAEASRHMHIVLGTVNTALLLTSSLAVAFAVDAARLADARRLRKLLLFAIALGIGFLCIKGYEYHAEWHEAVQAQGGEAQFYLLYYAMTGLHALHLTVGIGALAWLCWRARAFGPAYYAPVEVSGLYWHFVDCVWVFLYPMFYLMERYR